jgi:hypothetical protein
MSSVEHPTHYGGKNNPYEHIKVVETWGLGYHLGNATKYLARAGKKGDTKEDLEKALWYLTRAQEAGIIRGPASKAFLMSPRSVAEAWGLPNKLVIVLENACFGGIGLAIRQLQEFISDGEYP